MILTFGEWLASILGIIGAWLIGSSKAEQRRYGFIFFFLSSCLWVGWGVCTYSYGLVAMQTVYLITNIRGIMSNKKCKVKRARRGKGR